MSYFFSANEAYKYTPHTFPL